MSAIPEQVRRQAERANELMSQANAEPAAAPAAEPVVEAPAAAPVEPPPAPAAETPPPAPAPAAPDWEQKYRTLQGVFNAEKTRLEAAKRDAEARVQTLEAQLAAKPAAPAPAAVAIDPKDVETYGPELLEMVGRQAKAMAEQIVAARMADLQPQLEQTRDQVTNVSQQVYKNEQEKFYGELAKAVPDWQQVNDDHRWLEWLGQPDLMSGVARQNLLDDASSKLDHVRVATMFTVFKKEHGLVPPPAPAPAPAAAAAPAQSPSPRSVGTASAPPIREEGVSVKRSEIAAHYSRGARDAAYRNSQEHKAFELRIQQATATNRILEA